MDRKVISDTVTFYYYFSTVVFYVLHRKLFSIESPKKDFCLRRAWKQPSSYLFGSLKFLLHLFSDIYSNSQSIILDFSLPSGFLWQKIVKAGPWIYMCIIQDSRITFNHLGVVRSELRSADEYFMWDLCSEADTSSPISCFSPQVQGYVLWMEKHGLITVCRRSRMQKSSSNIWKSVGGGNRGTVWLCIPPLQAWQSVKQLSVTVM